MTAGGRKVVGLAQRRTRHGAWFHSACIVHWDPTALLGALVLDDDERRAAAVGLAGAVTGVADATSPTEVGALSDGDVATAFLEVLVRL